MKQSTHRPYCALRFWPFTALYPEELARQLRLVRQHLPGVDDMWLCTLLGLPSLEEHEACAKKSGEAAKMIRACGIGASLQIGESLGHWGYGAKSYAGFGDWRLMVGMDGKTSTRIPCILDEDFLHYAADLAAIYAKHIRPDTIWIDDDLRMNNHGAVQYGCFCPLCLEQFSQKTSRRWTREELADALVNHPEGVRLAWLQFNQERLAVAAGRIAAAVRAVSPETRLALQNCHLGFCYNGMDFNAVYKAMAENSGLMAGVRAGGGAYTDHSPNDLLEKAFSVGPTAQHALESGYVDLAVGEVENYPHSLLAKSAYSTAVEGALDMVFGCNGLSFVLGPYPSKTDAEEGEYFRMLAEFHELYVSLRSWREAGARPIGVNPARAPRHIEALAERNFDWLLLRFDEALRVLQCSVPVVWDIGRFAAPVAMITEELAKGFDAEAFDRICRGGALISGNAFLVLQEKGLTANLGIHARKIEEKIDYWELETADEFNGEDAGMRHYMPMCMGTSIAFSQTDERCRMRSVGRTVICMESERVLGDTTVLITTPQGGRWAVLGSPGYFSRSLTSYKQRQLLRLVDAVWPGGMPLMPEAGQSAGVVPWCREDGSLRGVAVFNANIGALREFKVELRKVSAQAQIRLIRPGAPATAAQFDPATKMLTVPPLKAWEVVAFDIV